ncbi:MAG TPA: hypothetical protein VEU96_24645 [Bryobacteraceae bacterium]|nr:hypothetical protein [Bryobacteraceae bacterium]
MTKQYALALLLASVGLVQSQPPTPTPGKTEQNDKHIANPKKTKSGTDDKSTEQHPFGVNKSTSPVASWNEQDPGAQGENQTSAPGWLIASTISSALATLAIAFLGYFQWRAMDRQAEYMRHALKATSKAAGAARDSAKAVMSGERARLMVDQVTADFDHVTLTFTNYGRTPARLTEFRFDFISTSAESVWPIDYSQVTGGYIPPINLPPQKSTPIYEAKLNFTGLVTDVQREEIYAGKLFLHFYGILSYRDIFGEQRHTPFYHTFQRPGYIGAKGGWRYSGPPEANECT